MQYEFKTMKLLELKPHPKNPRVHPEKLITKLITSIETYGFTNPVLVDADGRILAGHARCKAAEKMGLPEVPAVVLPLSGAAADAYVIADNKLNELSEWDEATLADLISEIDTAGFDVELTGFDINEIDALMSPKGCVEDDFDAEKALAEVEEHGCTINNGDMFMLGNHILMCGNPANPEDVLKLTKGQKAKLCVTSPPNNCKNIDEWFTAMTPAIKNICKNADTVCYNIADLYKTGTQYVEPVFAHSVHLFANNGFRPLWVRIREKKCKSSTHLSSAKPADNAEYVTAFAGDSESDIEVTEHSFVTAFADSNYKFVKRLSKQERKEWGYSSLWRFEKSNPVELPWRCIKMHSDKGDIVLDVFCNTGSSVIACEQSERICYAMCSDPKLVEVVIKRWKGFTEMEAVKIC